LPAQKKAKFQLIQLVKKPGRGAYIAIEPSEAQLAWDKRILDRVLEAKLTDEFYQELLDYVTHQKARRELFGNE
jgi:predicted RNA-binding protein YlxR (DUF448 family)